MNDLFSKVKESNQDYEWYPTTKEILKALYFYLVKQDNGSFSMLDIGAGNGKVFSELEKINIEHIKLFGIETDTNRGPKRRAERFGIDEKFAIEKSKILIEAMPKDIFIVGTDFHEQTLIDKKVDIIFCNPPYSEYVEWTEKILKEANSKDVYMVIPKRWSENKRINDIITRRGIKFEVIGEYDFLESEDRQARAVVNLIRFKVNIKHEHQTDPFDVWFEEHFKIHADKEKDTTSYRESETKKAEINALISKENIISEIVKLYRIDLEKLFDNYRALEKLDPVLFKELGIDINSIKGGLKQKISGLKNIYWQIVFDRLEAVTERLTKKSRQRLTKKLFEHTDIDITESNIYALVIWVIKNSNNYFDEQLTELYMRFADKENIRIYKSNKKMIEDGWRYNKFEMSHFSLDYRIITHEYSVFGGYSFDRHNGVSRSCLEYLMDIFTIGINLGFQLCVSEIYNTIYEPGKSNVFNDNNRNIFMECKMYKNGNIHLRFNPEFMKKLNIEAARINGWIKTPKDASKEFDISPEDSERYFMSNFVLQNSNIKGLLA